MLNASGFRRACRMAISRNTSSFPDFPEFAQAVSYGVPGTHAVASTLQCLSFFLPLSAVAGSHGPTAAARGGGWFHCALTDALPTAAPRQSRLGQANSLKPKPRRASPWTLRSHAAEEEKDQSSTAYPVYSFPGRRDHHLGPCLPRVARNGRPAPYPTLYGESSIMRESSSVPALVALTRAFHLALASARGADVNNGVRVPLGGRERALRGDSRGFGTCPEPQDPSSRHHSPTSYKDHRI